MSCGVLTSGRLSDETGDTNQPEAELGGSPCKFRFRSNLPSQSQLGVYMDGAHFAQSIATAEALFLTPSGLSVLIRELERQLGFRLFDRPTRQVMLTAQGSELLEITRRHSTCLTKECCGSRRL